MTEVLVLNASYEPLRIVPVRRAMRLLLQHKAELVEAAEHAWRAQVLVLDVPLVVRLIRYVALPHARRVPCSRRAVLARDGETCQYCGAQPGRSALTIDHVVPRAQGGQTTWENVVTACANCNHNKANRTPHQAGMTLARQPRSPHNVFVVLFGTVERHAVWRKYGFGAGSP